MAEHGVPDRDQLALVLVSLTCLRCQGVRHVEGDLPERHPRHPGHRGPRLVAGLFPHPVRLAPQQIRRPPDHRIRRILQVHDPGMLLPWFVQAAEMVVLQLGHVGGESDIAPVVDHRGDLRGADPAGCGQLCPQRGEARSARPDRAVGLVQQLAGRVEGGLAAEGAHRFPADQQLRTMIGRQLQPALVDGLPQVPAGLGGAAAVDDVGHAAGQERILHAGRGDIATGQVLDRRQRVLLGPAVADGGRDHEIGTLPRVGAVEFGDHGLGGRLDIASRSQPRVCPDRFHGRLAGDAGDVRRARAVSDHGPALASQGLPGLVRGCTARTLRFDRGLAPGPGDAVAGRGSLGDLVQQRQDDSAAGEQNHDQGDGADRGE